MLTRTLLAAAVAFTAVAVAAWIGYRATEPTSPDYAGYERVVRSYLGSDLEEGERLSAVERIVGTIYQARVGDSCVLIDPTKQYESEGGYYQFWINSGTC